MNEIAQLAEARKLLAHASEFAMVQLGNDWHERAVALLALPPPAFSTDATAAGGPAPIPMRLFCPACGRQHIDAPGLVHRSHVCDSCGLVWRPADVPTVGVAKIETRGERDTWDESPHAVPARTIPADASALKRIAGWLAKDGLDDEARVLLRLARGVSENEVLRHQVAFAEARLQRAIKVITRIHSFVLPDAVRLPDGRVFEFSNPAIQHEMMRGLRDAIRAVPDEIAALDAGETAPQEPAAEGGDHAAT